MNPFSEIEAKLRASDRGIAFDRELAKKPRGTSFLNVSRGKFSVSIEFKPGVGYGVTTSAGNDYGTGPDEVIVEEGDALARVLELLKTNGKTSPVRELSLRRLRELRKLTQEELARRLEVKQATVSKLEQRDEVLVSTLQRVVTAMGGKLDLIARFPDATLTLDLGDGELAIPNRGKS